MRHERVVGERRAGGHHLGARHHDSPVGLPLDAHADVGGPGRWLPRRQVAIDRRMDDRVVDEGHALLAEVVPVEGVGLVGRVELGIGAEGPQKGGLVVGGAAHPAIGESGPLGDGVSRAHLFGRGVGHAEPGVRVVARVGLHRELRFHLGIVQGVEQAREHAGGVAEGRVLGDLADPLAVDPHLAAVVEALQKLLAGHGHRGGGLAGAHESFLPLAGRVDCRRYYGPDGRTTFVAVRHSRL